MDWDRVNVWTNTFYTLIHSMEIAKNANFAELTAVNGNIISAGQWINPECSFKSCLLDHPFGFKEITFRRDPNKHFLAIAYQIVKMLVQDLTVIMDEMMAESLAAHGCRPLNFPQQKIERLSKFIDKKKFLWACNGCLELVAVRNVLTHANGRWNEQSVNLVKAFVDPPPVAGISLMIGVPMLFRYRKAMRTFLNETMI
jgi:hypothetical protein